MKGLFVFISVVSLLISTGCATFDPYTGEQKTSNTAKGAGVGAGVGVILAYLANKNKSSGERKKRMLKAAGIGAIAGGGVGYYMDTQEAELRKQLRNSGVSVARDGDNINLIMPGNITFNTGDATLNGSFFNVLDSVVLVLQKYNKTLIAVAGHTDSRGSEGYNQNLSVNRAASVADYLRSKQVSDARISSVGFGEQYPIADNITAEGQELNRRVELSLLPITQ